MLACTVPVQELFTRHGEGKYAPGEIELYRFGVSVWTLLDLQEKLQRNAQLEPVPEDLRLEWPEALQRKATVLPEELKHAPTGIDGNEISLVGMDDLSWKEGSNVLGMNWYGLYIEISDIRLNGLDDVQKAEALLNELADIVREAQEKDHGQIRPALSSEDCDPSCSLAEIMHLYEFSMVYCQFLPDGDLKSALTRNHPGLQETKIITDRECLAYMQSTGKCNSETNCLDPQEITFEAQDTGVNARLRFR